MNRRRKLSFVGIWLLSLVVLMWLAQTVFAAPNVPLSRTPVSGTATSVSATSTAEAANAPRVGTILLVVSGAPAKAWTVMQWQDGLGGWHDVDGWRGDLDDGQKMWAVLEANFGQGPFRWVIYEKRDGKVWKTSESFFLPKSAGKWVEVVVGAKAP